MKLKPSDRRGNSFASFRPSVELLEGRALPSATTAHSAALHTVAHVATAAPTVTPVSLIGQVSGVWATQPAIPGKAASQSLRGSGSVQPLGIASMSGTLTTSGTTGIATLTMTLTDAHGSITIQLTGPAPQPGGPATTLQYTILSGTGSHKGATGTGQAHLLEIPEQRHVSQPGQFTPAFIVAARFTLRFGP